MSFWSKHFYGEFPAYTDRDKERLRKEIEILGRSIEKMRTVLKFYSEHLRLDDGSLTFTSSLARDGGDLARSALAECNRLLEGEKLSR